MLFSINQTAVKYDFAYFHFWKNIEIFFEYLFVSRDRSSSVFQEN